MNHVLVVEDDARLADFMVRGLTAEGYQVTTVCDGRQGLVCARQATFDLIVLDVLLPGMSGLDVCRELRLASIATPILMLSALDAIEDKVCGLRLGADDYLAKPFAFDELVARIESLIRRGSRDPAMGPPHVVIGALRFDRHSLQVTLDGAVVEMTAKELALLELFLTAPGRVIPRERILDHVWGSAVDPMTNIVDVYVHRLRKKLRRACGGSPIVTLRGLGFKLDANAL